MSNVWMYCECSGEESSRSLRDSLREEDVISLRTAGDISLPRTASECVPLLASSPAYQTLASDGTTSYYQRGPYHFKVYDDRGLDPAYREQRQLFGDTYREPWPGGGSLREGKAKNKADKREKEKCAKNDKENDKYYCKGSSKKSSSKHRSSKADHIPTKGSRSFSTSGGDKTNHVSHLPQHPVYDNISATCIARPTNGYLLQSAPANGIAQNVASSTAALTNGHHYTTGVSWGAPHLTNSTQYRTYQQPVQFQQSHYYYQTPVGTAARSVSGGGGGGVQCGEPLMPPAARHNLQLRGLSSSQSHYLHMHNKQAQNKGQCDPAMVASTSPDYQLRWDLHNVTAASGPSRLSGVSLESNRSSDPTELCYSNLMVSHGRSESNRSSDPIELCYSNLMVSGDAGVPPPCSGGCSPHTACIVSSAPNNLSSRPPSHIVTRSVPVMCCDNTAAPTCCYCMSAVNGAAPPITAAPKKLSDPMIQLDALKKITDPLTLGELRGNQPPFSHPQYFTPNMWQANCPGNGAAPNVLPAPPLSSQMLVPPARPQSMLSVCNTTDCHMDRNTPLCPVQSLADLTLGSRDICCQAVFADPKLQAQQRVLRASGSNFKRVAAVPTKNQIRAENLPVASQKPNVVSTSSNNTADNNNKLRNDHSRSSSQPNGSVPYLVSSAENSVTAADVIVSSNVSNSSKVKSNATKPNVPDNNNGNHNKHNNTVILPALTQSSSSSSVVSLSAALQKTPAHIV